MNTLDRALYRGKRADTGEWFEGALVGDFIVGYFECYDFIHDEDLMAAKCVCHKVSPKTVGQWLGTTDNKGVKAFEGDIAEHYVDYPEQDYYGQGSNSEPISEYFTGIIGYQPSRGGVLKVRKMRDDFGSGVDVKHTETKNFYASRATIIGNIHDNPELIEVSK